MRKNCWEVNNCCRQPGAPAAGPAPGCPAASAAELDGINDGRNGGRVCWYVAGTLCGGERQGSFTDKQITCLACGFYQRVRREQGAGFRVKPARTAGGG